MRRGLTYHNRRSSGGYNPFSQLGPTLDLTFAGNVTNLSDPNGFTLDTNFVAPQYLIGAQYTIWETGVGLVSKTFSDIITFTRASTGTFFNSAGVLTSAAVDAPRFDYNPSTLAAQGLLIEESRTNSIRNNTMVGAVAGTPGTAPTNWSVSGLGTLTQQVVGTGTSNGITYIDVRFSGTTSTTQLVIRFDVTGAIAASNGQSWAISAWLAVVGGSTANTNTYTLATNLFDAGSVYLGEGPSINLASPPTSTFTRYSGAGTIATANTASIRPYFYVLFASGVAVDFTLRIGLPQLELGAFATSVIPTTTTALTRAADVASVNTLSPWYNASAGTIYAELQRYALIPSTAFANAWALSDNTNNERFLAYNTGSVQTMDLVVTDGGVGQATLVSPNAITANTTIKTAFAYAVNDFAFVRDAGAVQTDTSGTLPTVDRLYIGANETGIGQWTGYLRRITYYPRRLSNAELQAITA